MRSLLSFLLGLLSSICLTAGCLRAAERLEPRRAECAAVQTAAPCCVTPCSLA